MTTEIASGTTRKAGLEGFIARCHEAIRHQSQGRPEPFLRLWSHADDVSLMGGVGGHQVGIHDVTELLTAAAKTLNYETWDAENLATVFEGPDVLLEGGPQRPQLPQAQRGMLGGTCNAAAPTTLNSRPQASANPSPACSGASYGGTRAPPAPRRGLRRRRLRRLMGSFDGGD